MFFALDMYPTSRKAVTDPLKFRTFINLCPFTRGNEIVSIVKEHSFGHYTHFSVHPCACIALNSFLYFLSPRAQHAGFCSSSNLDARGVEREKFDHGNEAFNMKGPMGFDNCDSGMNKNSRFTDFDEVEDSDDDDEEEEERDSGGDGDSDEKDFMVLNAFKRTREQGEETRRIEIGEEEFRHPLVREICRLIDQRSAWNPKLEGQMRHLLRSLKPRQVCAVLQSQADERVALRFFYWADQQWRYRHDPIVYYAMLEVLSKTKLCQGARRVLRLMTRRGIYRQPEAFCYVMVSYSRAGRLRNAMQMLTVMHKAGIEPNLLVCNTSVHVLVMANRLEKALRFVERMQLVGITLNVVTYNCLIKGYCDIRRVEDAMELIAQMPFKGCPPDKVSYLTVMNSLCKDKRIKEVREFMERMKKDSKLLPDQVTYNTLIHVLSKHHHADEALEFLREAEERGFKFDKVEYSAIVDSFCKVGRMDQAKEIVNEMIAKGCIPDVVTYTAVVNGLCQLGMVEQAKKMLQQMHKHGCKPNTISYTALLNGLCQTGRSLCIQIFDSWGGQLPPHMWASWSMPYIKEIVDIVKRKCPATPLVLYINGNGGLLEYMKQTGVDVIGLDWTVDMADGRKRLGSGISLQGNVDPAYLFSPLPALTDEIQRVVRCAGPRGHILNLGHGVLVGTPEEAVTHFFEVARSLKFTTPVNDHAAEEQTLVV